MAVSDPTARRILAPDVAFLSYARLSYDRQIAIDVPTIAPDVVVEILSPDDRAVDVEEKSGYTSHQARAR